jgi:hypothetical protein
MAQLLSWSDIQGEFDKMFKKIIIFLLLFMLMLFFFFVFSTLARSKAQAGVFNIYFMEEKVGYEEYTWESNREGYFLSVKGRMTKPSLMIIEKLTLQLDRDFIPRRFYFKGSANGVLQEISSTISEGKVENEIKISGQERKSTVRIKRDAFLLPNPIFSTYLVLTKKHQCTLKEKIEHSAYIIPQLEVSFTLQPKEGDPCSLIMELSGIQIELETDNNGDLKALYIPSQKLQVVKSTS